MRNAEYDAPLNPARWVALWALLFVAGCSPPQGAPRHADDPFHRYARNAICR